MHKVHIGLRCRQSYCQLRVYDSFAASDSAPCVPCAPSRS